MREAGRFVAAGLPVSAGSPLPRPGVVNFYVTVTDNLTGLLSPGTREGLCRSETASPGRPRP